ncbi:MAG: GTPase ObgE [Rickettsiales bacterium]|jgi:GTP-binding protein|nr:GTPase ObgE [Rickettsiales bacterium]
MQFIDEVNIRVKSGNGGNGKVGFSRLKYRPKGGPDGGDGGRGGNIIFKTTRELNTLLDYRFKREFEAENGQNGQSSCGTGRNGSDLVLAFPIGTQVLFSDGTLFCDLDRDKMEVLVAKGGNGGYGNARFKSSTNQAPRTANPGQEGVEFDLILKLKLLSDVGLVGLPNAGKSTFLSVATRAKPKIADYPFTTLEPKLGVVNIDDTEFIIADLPGLIENASEGKGLGDRFLKHVERCSILLHLIDAGSDDILKDYKTIRKELESNRYKIADKREIVVLTKADNVSDGKLQDNKDRLEEFLKTKVFTISSITRSGVRDILKELEGSMKENGKNKPNGANKI